MPKPTKSYHHLKPEDRMTIASLMQQNYTQRDIAKLLGCSASTISRELGRNAQGKTYDSQSAQRACQHRRIASRPQRKLHTESILFGVVHTLMRSRWSPEQIALTLGQTYPKGHELRVSHETIYNCIYAQPVALAIGYGLGRYRAFSFQNHGEALVCRELQANFSGPDFHLLNHITLKIKDGTTQVDHILVSRFGVFVIETKDYKGWIFANAKHATWTQVLYRVKFKFQNPIFQNMRHVRAVEELLDFLPPETIKSVVVFTGRAEFKTDMPSGVYTLSGLIDHLKSATEEVMSLNRVQFCVGRLETARLAITGQTDLEHVKSLQRKHGGPR